MRAKPSRIVRIAAVCLAIIAIAAGGFAGLIAMNRDRIVALVLMQVRDRTGLEITPRATSFRFRNHLIVVLDSPEIAFGGNRVARLHSLRAAIGYHSILFSSGLPLYSITASGAEVTLPASGASLGLISAPRPGPEAVAALRDMLLVLGRVAWRFEANGGKIDAANGAPIADRVELLAFHRHHGPTQWSGRFSAIMRAAPIVGANAAGHFSIDTAENPAANRIAHGEFEIGGVPLKGLEAEGFALGGETQGRLSFDVHPSGSIAGEIEAGAQGLTLSGPRLAKPMRLEDLSMAAAFNLANGKYSVSEISVRRGDLAMAAGATQLTAPYGENPELGIHLGGIHFDAAALKRGIGEVRRLPHEIVAAIGRIRSGQVSVTEAALTAAIEKVKTAPLETIRQNLTLAVAIRDAGFTLPPAAKLPPVEHLSAELRYAKGILTLSDGRADFGNSAIRGASGEVDLSKGIANAPYRLQAKANLDLADLSAPLLERLNARFPRASRRLIRLGGPVDATMAASGRINAAKLAPPSDYTATLRLRGAVATVKDAPGPIEASGGAVTIAPAGIDFNRLKMTATGGEATVDGSLKYAGPRLAISRLAVEFKNFPSRLWLDLLVKPADFAMSGPLAGRIEIQPDPAAPGLLLPRGSLTVAAGQVQFNFLRAPIIVRGASVTFKGRTVDVAMPGSTLQGAPIDFRITIPDFRHPTMRMDIQVQQLDLEVMKFIRLPWSPATPPVRFPIPVSGRIDARRANLAKFEMRDVKTDFMRAVNGNWRVYNLAAIAYHGRMKLDIAGTGGGSNWIHIQGSTADLDSSALFAIGGGNPPLSGHLSLSADLWADADTDFFKTLAGKIYFTARDGTLNKFPLLSRLLGLVDIKNWLTANLPDPRVNGVPFDSILADFKGKDGRFYTDNFTLQGKVMDIVAAGNVQFGAALLDLEVGMFPFDTVNWILNKIPLIGERVGSGTGKLVAAYFQVSGPVSDPSITPKPITSVAEFVKRTLGMPINLLVPHTVK
ncbi:MAG: AsmA-like C-terminal domain-containing protein [Candidatus Binataceae bacterium]